MLVLGIDTSCDETAASLVRDGNEIVSNIVSSQVELHTEYGGVVPEIAARAHVESMVPVVEMALSGAQSKPDVIAVTNGPGLVGSLVVGLSAAKGLSWAWGIPLVCVNHLEAHAFAPVLEGAKLEYPFLALVVSGGHTLLARVNGVDRLQLVGETRDDALGEAYDKVSKYLGLGYPGGPVIDGMSQEGDPGSVDFPRPMIKSGDYNFSLSGLKTAVIRYIEGRRGEGRTPVTADVVASFQEAALEVIVDKTVRAACELGVGTVVAGGGVACNRRLRGWLGNECERRGLKLVVPSPQLCTDNGAMVAAHGYLLYLEGCRSDMNADVFPGMRLGERMQGRAPVGGCGQA